MHCASRLRWMIACVAAMVAAPFYSTAQDAGSGAGVPVSPLAFEVATVKPDDPSKMVLTELRVYPGGRLVIHAHSLRTLIGEAFHFPGLQIIGGEKWVDERTFDIEGKPPEEMRNSVPGGEYAWFGIQDANERAMLQALLIERFRLRFHVEKQPGTVYALSRSAGPLRIEHIEPRLYSRSEDGTVSASDAPTTGQISVVSGSPVSFQQTSMAQLAGILSSSRHAPVTDETGLPGFYNFRSKTVTTEEDFKSGSFSGLLVEALAEMGLKLVKTQGTVEKFVIDHAELPTAD